MGFAIALLAGVIGTLVLPALPPVGVVATITGMFLAAGHTLDHFREWMFMSPLFRSQAYVTWQKQGSLTADRLATAEWKALLERYEDPGIDDAVDEELREYMARRRAEIGTAA